MSNVTTLNFEDKNITIDQELFQGYLKEAFERLAEMEEATDLFKEVVDTVSETTGLKKPRVAKYFKERFAATTKKTKELGALFEKLDEVVEG